MTNTCVVGKIAEEQFHEIGRSYFHDDSIRSHEENIGHCSSVWRENEIGHHPDLHLFSKRTDRQCVILNVENLQLRKWKSNACSSSIHLTWEKRLFSKRFICSYSSHCRVFVRFMIVMRYRYCPLQGGLVGWR